MITDILIVGAGPAGMSAALSAAPGGARIVMLDDNPTPGGQIWRDGPQSTLPSLAQQYRERIAETSNIKVLTGTRVIARVANTGLLVEDEHDAFTVHYQTLILCTGARERLLPFPGWTLPGVTGAGALQALVKGGMPTRNKRLVIAGSGPLLLATAATATANGASIALIAEQAGAGRIASFIAQLPRWPNKFLQAPGLFNSRYRTGSIVVEAYGDKRLEAVRVSCGDKVSEIACELLACGFGLTPNTELAQAFGCVIRDGAIHTDGAQCTSQSGVLAAGECTGVGGNELARVEGAIAGYTAIGNDRAARALDRKRQHWQRFAQLLDRTFQLDPRIKGLCRPDTLVCRCEDVSHAALVQKTDWRQAKLATRCGMGACQGRICGAATGHMFGWERPPPRPPYVPARLETLASLDESSP
jgi:NADPH-dependent 2,4-dienoyl-CoA reductase/sulfur reductase-like enzyme